MDTTSPLCFHFLLHSVQRTHWKHIDTCVAACLLIGLTDKEMGCPLRDSWIQLSLPSRFHCDWQFCNANESKVQLCRGLPLIDQEQRTDWKCRPVSLPSFLLDSPEWLSQYSDYATSWTTGVQFPAGTLKGLPSLRHCVQTNSGAHQASYPGGKR
jgi:hypothetical protein